MNFKEIKTDGKNNLKGNYLKFFIISLISFVLCIEIKFVFSQIANPLNIIQISYFMVFVGLFIRPVYVFYLKNVYLSLTFDDFKSIIRKTSYKKIIGVFFIRKIIVFISFLLLVVPGIYKALEYAFVPYILAENPELTIKEIFEKSSNIMKGNKLKLLLFVLDYLKWYLLGFLCLGVGILFVNPYFEMNLRNLYKKEFSV